MKLITSPEDEEAERPSLLRTLWKVAAGGESDGDEIPLNLVQLPRPPAKFELMHNTAVFKWVTTAKHARKIIGPMREWAEELQCRTGVHADMDALYPEKAAAGDYASADDVETAVYFFGAEKAVAAMDWIETAKAAKDSAASRDAVFVLSAALACHRAAAMFTASAADDATRQPWKPGTRYG